MALRLQFYDGVGMSSSTPCALVETALLTVRNEALKTMRGITAIFLLLCVGCGSSGTPAAEHPEVASNDPSALPAAHKGRSLPDHCAHGKPECVPPPGWVQRLCEDVYPDVALNMFKPGTRWKRLYMLARADPFNASGGASLLGDKLERGEEVIALKRRDNNGEMQVGDNAGYDVLRWNGACATIHDDDFTEEPPRAPRSAPLDWRRLSVEMRQALEAIPEIGEVYELRHQKCRGKSVGRISDQCELYDKKLSVVVAEKVRAGAKLPMPALLP